MGLGRAEMCVEVYMMYSQLALPRFVQLQEFLHLFAYLKVHTNSELVFDPNENAFEKYEFPMQDFI